MCHYFQLSSQFTALRHVFSKEHRTFALFNFLHDRLIISSTHVHLICSSGIAVAVNHVPVSLSGEPKGSTSTGAVDVHQLG